MKTLTIALAALAALPAQAQAAGPEAAPVVRISVADLNLHSEAGLRTLDRRLAQAVRTVCSDPSAEAQLARQRSVKRCISLTRKELAVQRERVLAAQAAPALLAARGR